MTDPAAPRPGVGATTVTGIIGWPVDHSVSPAVNNAAFRQMELDWVYVAFPVPPGRLAEALTGMKALGIAGANVTMPHKDEAASLADDLAPEARRLGAANTIVRRDDALIGHNTDAEGFARFLADAGFEPRGRTAVLFGAGGAARACAATLADGGVARLIVAARTTERQNPLANAVEGTEVEVEWLDLSGGVTRVAEADLVVNATPLGSMGERLVPSSAFTSKQTVVDLIYRPPLTPLLEDARAAGARAHGGLGMLLHQAALSFELWTGRIPPLDVMSAAALADLSRSAPI